MCFWELKERFAASNASCGRVTRNKNVGANMDSVNIVHNNGGFGEDAENQQRRVLHRVTSAIVGGPSRPQRRISPVLSLGVSVRLFASAPASWGKVKSRTTLFSHERQNVRSSITFVAPYYVL